MKTMKKLRYMWMRLRYRAHLVVRRIHDRLFAEKKRYYQFHQKPYAGHVVRGIQAVSVVLVLVGAIGLFNIFQPGRAWAASVYSWVQTDWTCGADTSNFPVHPTNKTAWCKFFSKDNSISTSTAGQVTLSSGSSAFTDNTTAGYNAGTKNNVGVNANQALLLKPDGATAANAWECKSGNVLGGVCAWGYTGRAGSVLAGKQVFARDIASTDRYYNIIPANGALIGTNTPIWKLSNTACVSPQCAVNGPVAETQSGYTGTNVLVADNAVNFNPSAGATPDYPARDACKALGGRLPTIAELIEIYNYKSTYGNNFQSSYYWSEVEGSSNYAYGVYLNGGFVNNVTLKTRRRHVKQEFLGLRFRRFDAQSRQFFYK